MELELKVETYGNINYETTAYTVYSIHIYGILTWIVKHVVSNGFGVFYKDLVADPVWRMFPSWRPSDVSAGFTTNGWHTSTWGFSKTPKWIGLQWNIPWKWVIQGFPISGNFHMVAGKTTLTLVFYECVQSMQVSLVIIKQIVTYKVPKWFRENCTHNNLSSHFLTRIETQRCFPCPSPNPQKKRKKTKNCTRRRPPRPSSYPSQTQQPALGPSHRPSDP